MMMLQLLFYYMVAPSFQFADNNRTKTVMISPKNTI